MATSSETRRRRRGLDLTAEVRNFVRSHPGGWNHGDWLAFVSHLEQHGYDVSDPERIGVELERARLAEVLQALGINGLGPQRRQALIERFGTLWELRHATAERMAEVRGINLELARRIRSAL
ncbi:MAG: helix-hairpin-helix domain-containing protein [Longimicrobiales bacterium]